MPNKPTNNMGRLPKSCNNQLVSKSHEPDQRFNQLEITQFAFFIIKINLQQNHLFLVAYWLALLDVGGLDIFDSSIYHTSHIYGNILWSLCHQNH